VIKTTILTIPILVNKKLHSTSQAKKAQADSFIYTYLYHVLSRANTNLCKAEV